MRHSFQHLKRIAKEIVWKRLEEDYNELDSLLSDDFPRHGVKDALKTIVSFLKLQKL